MKGASFFFTDPQTTQMSDKSQSLLKYIGKENLFVCLGTQQAFLIFDRSSCILLSFTTLLKREGGGVFRLGEPSKYEIHVIIWKKHNWELH